MEKIKNKKKSILIKTLFGIYCVLLVWIILFKFSFTISELDRFRSINLIPFYYSNETGIHLTEVIENILIFIPFGIYLKMLGVNNKKSILFGLGLSFILETMQYILKVGASDITDIITNTLGTVLGVFGYVLLSKIFENIDKLNNVIEILALIATILLVLLLGVVTIANM